MEPKRSIYFDVRTSTSGHEETQETFVMTDAILSETTFQVGTRFFTVTIKDVTAQYETGAS